MQKLSFKAALLLSVSLVVTISMGLSNYLSFSSEKALLEQSIYANTKERVDLEAEKLKGFLSDKALAVTNLASAYRQNNYADGHAERMKVSALSSNVENMMIGFENGDAYASQDYPGWMGNKNPSSYDPRVRPWYQQAKSGQTVFTEPYEDAVNKVLLISIAKSFGEGTILADISLEVLTNTVNKIDIPGSLALIIAEDTTTMASTSSVIKNGSKLNQHPDLKQVAREVIGQSSAEVEYNLEGVDKVLFSKRIELGEQSWYLLIALDKEVVFAQVEEAKNTAIFSTLIYLVVTVILVLLAINYLYRPILELKKMVMSLASGDGDLTQRLEVRSKDDLGQIATGINQFIENLQSLMLEIESASTTLKSDVGELTRQTRDNSTVLSQHLVETEQIIAAIEEMNATAETVAQNATETAQFVADATTLGTESQNVVGEAYSKVSSLVGVVENTADSIQHMSDETRNISSILSVIGEIAEQTNLLALNAAIEAARAGEQGRGFAVVADEVRALASRTQQSTGEIEHALNSLLQGSNSLCDSMEMTKSNCNETMESTTQVGNQIGDLTSHIAEINDLSTQIATAAEQQSSVTQEVSRNMASINEIVSQLNNNGEQTAVQTESINVVNEQLSHVVERFKLK